MSRRIYRRTQGALVGTPNRGRLKRLIKEVVRFRHLTLSMGAEALSKPLLGKVGEYYAFLELLKYEKYGLGVEEKSGHSAYDFLIVDGDQRKKIEVRTSLLKEEGIYPKGIKYFGWRVETYNARKSISFDIFIGIALRKDFTEPQFYLFTASEVKRLGKVSIGRYKSVKRKIHLFPDKIVLEKATKAKPNLITPWERHINLKREKYFNRWGLITPRNLFTTHLSV